MGFFNDFKNQMEKRDSERKNIVSDIPEKKDYQPGHKNSSGTVKKMALINMFGTSDLDEVIEGCAPHFTETVYGIRDKLNYEEQDYKAKYYELKGRYDELQKNYQDLVNSISKGK